MAHPSAFNSDDSQPQKKQLQLVVHAGPLAGKGFPITGQMLTFGRDPDNDITLDDTQVSRHHARLIRRDDEITVEDLGSTNGTLINGKAVSGKQVLQPADIISIGSSVFGVKGFAAPSTVGITQASAQSFSYTPPRPSIPTPALPSVPGPSSPPVPTVRPPSSPQEVYDSSRLTFLAIGGIIALIILVLLIAGLTAYFFNQGGSAAADIPAVNITAPLNDSEVTINLPVTVQATASSPSGITRMELWVRGVKVEEAISPAPDGQQTLTASFKWTPEAPGTYTLEVRAYNAQEAVSSPTTVTVNAVGEEDGSGDTTPTPSTTPEPIETVSGNPSLTTRTDLNVRGGPGIAYDLLGLLPTSTEVEIIGRDINRQWWQIRFDPAADGRGWVAADPAFSTANNVENVPVVEPPPTPTGTSTGTPTQTPTVASTLTPTADPPTFTPTPTETAAVDTPTPTPTFTPTPDENTTTIEFTANPTTIAGGDCATISWKVSGVKEVYFEGLGVGGEGTVQDCPNETRTYRLRVVKLDNTEQTQEIQVQVVNPASIKSSGSIVFEPNDTFDIDDGDIPGDDFIWEINENTRRFLALEDVSIAVMGNFDSLDQVSRTDCLNAGNYGVYSYIDGSNSAPDSNNTLVDGRIICYRTNKDRIGKLRFPEYSPEDLQVEWLTWQE